MRRLSRACVWLVLLGCVGRTSSLPAADAGKLDAPESRIVCFGAGTGIATPAGERAIEALRPGDAVLAFDLRRGLVVESHVTAIHVHPGQVTGRLPVAGGRTLRVTPEHPVYLPARGAFVPVRELPEKSAVLSLFDHGAVKAVMAGGFATPPRAPETVYNLTVAELENYFADGILVHNKSPPRCESQYGWDCPRPPTACDDRWPRATVSGPVAARRLALWLWGLDEAVAVAEAERVGFDPGSSIKLRAFIDWLLADSRALEPLRAFTQRWLGLTSEAPAHVPEPLWAAFQEETARFLEHVLLEGKNDALAELLLANYTFADARLAAHYGLAVDAGAGWTKVPVDTRVRGGLLAQGSFLAQYRSAPGRGEYVYERLFQCSPFPEIPNFHPDALGPGTPARAAVNAAVKSDSVCGGCHGILDGVGWPLQNFDELARFRTTDSDGQPVDATGWLDPPGSNRKSVTGRGGLAEALLATTEARTCLTRQVLDHASVQSVVPLPDQVAACLASSRTGTSSYRELLHLVGAVLVRDWPGPDGGVPDAQSPAPLDAAPADAAP